MPFQKGRAKTGGRKKGLKLQKVADTREHIRILLEQFAPSLGELIREIKRTNGAAAAFDAYAKLLEFGVPKLQRTELTGKDGKDLPVILQAAPYDDRL
jgi:hypothetical protein